ncbi:hypothetical protein DACRYDRAFT_24323 [Dacryopinax primogenitus]|uniref:Uncharacterized protein n=1 Tax=Dacryopinax primogenitus (strain DJM 731) TaxID=1858805 RepID=M5FYV9_DACPD|nr:uncharacterized protein DACRYDRAFT_24323 [Dacryopinax primogenitus]EJT98756.1 hypothetical protein DACRYDRAFT_24323 [Dacryopinax primogenitus]
MWRKKQRETARWTVLHAPAWVWVPVRVLRDEEEGGRRDEESSSQIQLVKYPERVASGFQLHILTDNRGQARGATHSTDKEREAI